MLKQRIKKIEDQVIVKQLKNKPEMEKKVWHIFSEQEQQNIIAGKIKHKDGSYYSEYDLNLLVIRIITDKKPME